MLAVRIESGLILMLVRSYLVNNPVSDNWAIIRYKGEPPEEPVWTYGELPNVDVLRPIETQPLRELILNLRNPTPERIEDTLLARFPMATMRRYCARIKRGPLHYCWVGNIVNERKLRPTKLEEERWMFKPWDQAEFDNPRRKKSINQRPPGTSEPQRPPPLQFPQQHERNRQEDRRATGTG